MSQVAPAPTGGEQAGLASDVEEALDSSADEAEAEAEAAGDDAAVAGGDGKKPAQRRRRRKTATDLNLISDPKEVIVELTDVVLQARDASS